MDRGKYNTFSVSGQVVTAWLAIIIGIPVRNNTHIAYSEFHVVFYVTV